MSTKAKYTAGNLTFYDSVTHERVKPLAPFLIEDDFIILNTNTWTARDTGAATEACVADGASGILALTLTNANEAQLAGADWGDNRPLRLNQGLIFDTRVQFETLPTGLVVACIGLCGDHDAAVDTVAESIWFRADGSGAVTVETDDTVNETSKVATGTTLTAGVWAVLRIDCTTITDIKFYINGNRVASSTTFTMAQVAALALQPVLRIGKEGIATTVGTLYVDYVRVWQNRS